MEPSSNRGGIALRVATGVLKLLLAVAFVLAGLAPGAAAVAAENGVWANASFAGGTHSGEAEIGPELASGATLAAKGVGKAVQRAPDFIVTPSGKAIPVPSGATGPSPALSGKGFRFEGGSGGHGLDQRVSGVRIMDPTSKYPGGYVNYYNSSGQAVNPYTGKTISKSYPWWHIPLD